MKAESRSNVAKGAASLELLAVLVLTAFTPVCRAQPGAIDTSFRPALNACSWVSLLALQGDDKVLYFASVPCMPLSSAVLGRINSDGSIDSGFVAVSFTNGTPHVILQDTTGRVLVGGSFLEIAGQPRSGFARLLSNGLLDSSFAPGLAAGSDVLALAIQTDGRILIAGQFTNLNGITRNGVARLEVNGLLDLSFDPGTAAAESISNGVHAVKVLSSGKVLVAGGFTNFNGVPRSRIAQLNADGSLDATFDPGSGPDQAITAMAVQPDGKIIIGGEFMSCGGIIRKRIARLNGDGTLDTTFDPAPGITMPNSFFSTITTIAAIRLQTDGHVLVGGAFNYANDVLRPGLARLNPDGSLDYDFDATGGQNGSFDVSAMIVQTNGQIVVAGPFSTLQGVNLKGLVRLNASGSGGAGRFEFALAQSQVNEGQTNAVFTVLRTGGSQGPASVSYSTADGTAHAPARYIPTSGVLSFASGETSKTFAVPIVDDHIAENQGCCSIYIDVLENGGIPWEVFSVGLQNPTGGAVLGSQSYSLMAIEDNDTAFSLDATSYSVGELDGLASVTVQRLGNRSGTNEVICSTQDLTAAAGLDYVAKSSTLVFAPGEVSKTFRFVLLENPLALSNETLQVTLSSPTGGAFLMDPSNTVVTIQDQPGIVVSTLPGAVDTSFIPGGGPDGTVDVLAYQADGKLLVGGSFATVDGITRNNITRMNLDGSVDLTFDPGVGPNGEVLCLTAQPDGKILVAGDFTQVQGVGRNHVARLNSDGSLDLGFDPGTGAQGDFSSGVFALVLQTDGKLIVAGSFTNFNGAARHSIARLKTDGSLDNGFDTGNGPEGGTNPFPAVRALGLQADGKIFVAGDFSSFAGKPCGGVARLNPDASLDPGFNSTSAYGGGVRGLVVQSDNKVILGGGLVSTNGSILARLNDDGSADGSFAPWMPNFADSIAGLALQTDDKLLVGGSFTTFNGVSRNRIVRLNPDGKLDVTFDPGSGADNSVRAVALAPDGAVGLGGDFSRVNGRLRIRLAQLHGGDPPRSAPTLTQLPTSQQVVQGQDVLFSVVATGFPLPVFQWTFNGVPIPGATGSSLFLPNVGLTQGGNYGVSVTNDLGSAAATASLVVLAAPSQPGALDLSFYPGSGFAGSSFMPATSINAIAVKADGKMLVGGVFSSNNFLARNGVAQLNADGSLDKAFDPSSAIENGGVVQAVAFQPDGKALVAGWFFFDVNGVRMGTIARLNADGTVDSTFNPQSGAGYTINALVVQSDGKILIGGDFVGYNGNSRQGVARLNRDGSLDTSFDPGTGTPADLTGGVLALALQNDGKVVMGGSFNYVAGQARAGIARLNSDGSLDTNFNSAATVNGTIQKLAVQTDGKIVLAGSFTQVNGVARAGIARLNSDGNLDTFFDPGTGADGFVWAMALQNYGRILIGGSFANFNGFARHGFARLNSDGSLDQSVDPGAGADATVYSLALQSDGRIVVGGSFTNFDNRPRQGIARLLSDPASAGGELEFSSASQSVPENSGTNLLLHVRRIGSTNGLVQVSYGVGGGTAVASADFLPVSGTLVFNDGDSVEQTISIAVIDDQVAQGNRNVEVWLGNPTGGAVWGTNSAENVNIIDDDIAFDFSTNRFSAREDQGALVLAVRRLGNTSAANSVSYATSDASTRAGIDYVAQSGTLTFSPGETNKLVTIQILDDWQAEEDETLNVTLSQPTGGAYIGSNSPATLTIVDTHRPGTVDASFISWRDLFPFFFGQVQVNSIGIEPDGGILLGGDFNDLPAPLMSPLVRLLPDGTLDTNYLASIPGSLVPPSVSLVRVQPDGKALVVTSQSVGGRQFMRLLTNGLPDPSFNTSAFVGQPLAVELQPDAKIVVAGRIADTNNLPKSVLRLNSDGSLDLGFSPPELGSDFGAGIITSLAIDSIGKIWIAGGFTTVAGVSRYDLARLGPNGSLDTGFNAGAGLVDQFGTHSLVEANCLAVQPDGKLLVGGSFAQVNGAFRTNIARLNADGSIDTVFNASVDLPFGRAFVSSLVLQRDGRILVGGKFSTVDGVPRNGIARLLADGSVDLQFHSSQDAFGLLGAPYLNLVYALALQPDGQVLIGGNFSMVDGLARNCIARLNGTLLSPHRPILQVAEPSNGRFKVTFTGASGQTYFLMASTNCLDWVLLGRPIEPTTGVFEFEDPDSVLLPQRVYRVFSP